MVKTRTTLTLSDETLRAVKIRAARMGLGESQVMEEAIRSALGLDLLERQWAQTRDLSDDEAMEIALSAQREARDLTSHQPET